MLVAEVAEVEPGTSWDVEPLVSASDTTGPQPKRSITAPTTRLSQPTANGRTTADVGQ